MRLIITALIAALIAANANAAPPLLGRVAKSSKDFTGVVVKVLDGDTYLIQRDNDKGEPVKVRLHWADCPEIAHNKNEADQPGGREALEFASSHLLNRKVSVHPCGDSYGRVVGDVTDIEGKYSMAAELVDSGNAMVDARYKPTKLLLDLQANAKKKSGGLWSDPTPVAPWTWRKLTRDQQIKARGK